MTEKAQLNPEVKSSNKPAFTPLMSLEIVKSLTTKINSGKKRTVSKLKHSEAKVQKTYRHPINLIPISDEERNAISKEIQNANTNSILGVFNECHPDIKKLLHLNMVIYTKAEAGKLTLHLSNGLRFIIENMANNRKHYIILNARKKEILNITG